VLDEPGSAEAIAFLRGIGNRVTSVVARAEVGRTVALADPRSTTRAAEVLARLSVIELDGSIVSAASTLRPPGMGVLGAIHIASAMLLADALDAFLTYDPIVAAAARGASLRVESPGVELATSVDVDEPRASTEATDPALLQRVVDRLVGRLRPGRIIEPADAPPSDGVLHLAMVPGPWSPGRGAIWIGQEAIEDLGVRLDLVLIDEDTPEPAGRILFQLD
jgi:hypothetical protein